MSSRVCTGGAHQAVMDSSKPLVTQMVWVKLSGIQNNMNLEKGFGGKKGAGQDKSNVRVCGERNQMHYIHV